jgi:hypothetical protein
MPQIVLYPSDAAQAVEQWKPNRPISDSALAFGYVPDVRAWRPGDLLLFSAVHPNLIQRRITAAQSRQFLPDHARWQHAAMYMGRGRICEATVVGGVRVADLYSYVPESAIRVRRCPILALDEEGSCDLVFEALSRLGQNYSLTTIWNLWKRTRLKSLVKPYSMTFTRPTHVCSGLYADAFSQSTRRVVYNGGGDIPMPAQLSVTDQLNDVESSWLRLID